ncbi:MAG TPA: hypothetical protein VJ822_00305 [Dongiaceae bacterium]|nr:hypothetical protein [Dongiaceae bacterium]
MKNKSAVAWAAAAAVFCLLLIGYFALQSGAGLVSEHPNNRANHHPK